MSGVALKPTGSRFFLVSSALFLAIVFGGFTATFYARPSIWPAEVILRRHGPVLPLHLYVHGVLLTAWFVLWPSTTASSSRSVEGLEERYEPAQRVDAAEEYILSGLDARVDQVGRRGDLQRTATDCARPTCFRRGASNAGIRPRRGRRT